MSERLAGLVNELVSDLSEENLMGAVSEIADVFQNQPRSVYAEAASLIISVDEAAARMGNVPSLLAAMSVLAVVRLHTAAPSEDHYRMALRAWGRESVRQHEDWPVTYDRIMAEIVEVRADMLRIAAGPVLGKDDVEGYPPADDADELDAAIELARKDPRWPDVSAVISVLQKRVRF